MVALATATAAATTAMTAMQRRGGNATEMVMDGNGWCNNNATAMTAMEGVTAMQRQWNVTMTTMDGVMATETGTATETAMGTATAMAMATATATATGMATAAAKVTVTAGGGGSGNDDTTTTAETAGDNDGRNDDMDDGRG